MNPVELVLCALGGCQTILAAYNLQKVFEIGLGSAAYNYSKLYIEIDQKKTAARWFKAYVEDLLSTKYDHQSNPYFEKIKLEVDPDGQKIIRKKCQS